MRANLRKLLVVGTTAGRVDQSSGDARNEEIVADLELDGVIDSLALGLQHVVELFGLYDGSREAVEDEAVLPREARVQSRYSRV